MKRLVFLAAWSVLALPPVARAEPMLSHTDVFVSGQDGYHTFRVPAIETAPDGSLLASCGRRQPEAGVLVMCGIAAVGAMRTPVLLLARPRVSR